MPHDISNDSAVFDPCKVAEERAARRARVTGGRSNGRAVLEPLSINAVAGRVRTIYQRAILHFHKTRPAAAARQA